MFKFHIKYRVREEFIHPSTLGRGTRIHFDFIIYYNPLMKDWDLGLIDNILNICNFIDLGTVTTGIQIHKTNIKKDMFQ